MPRNTQTSRSRYVFEPHVDDFLQTVIETGASRLGDIEEGAVLYRAQVGHEWNKELIDRNDPNGDYVEIPGAYGPARMKPPKGAAREGRVNPKGIPCLYLADEPNTAMAETRPWLGSYVSLAEFKILRPLRIMDLPEPERSFLTVSLLFGAPKPDAATREKAVWGEVAYAFSEPVIASDDKADYVPTQILAEAFQKLGCDGIRYKSRLGNGYSFALFDLDSAVLINCAPFETKAVAFEFNLAGHRYYIAEHYPEVTQSLPHVLAKPREDSPTLEKS